MNLYNCITWVYLQRNAIIKAVDLSTTMQLCILETNCYYMQYTPDFDIIQLHISNNGDGVSNNRKK